MLDLLCLCSRPDAVDQATSKLLGKPLCKFSATERAIYRYVALSVQNDAGRSEIDESGQAHGDKQLFKPCQSLPATHHQQTYTMWRAGMDLSFNWRRLRRRHSIYILPLDDFPPFITDFKLGTRNFFQLLTHFAHIFFDGLSVKLLPALNTEAAGWHITSRYHTVTKRKQLLVGDVQRHLKSALPADGYCILGISWTDLYPSEELNFVLGEAMGRYYAGAFSFGRFEPKSYKGDDSPPPIKKVDGALLWKMFKVLSHETCHLFSVTHCVHFSCLMNESHSVEEALGQPAFLCPMCLRKLRAVTNVNIKHRYIALRDLFTEINNSCPHLGFESAVLWLDKCISDIIQFEEGNAIVL